MCSVGGRAGLGATAPTRVRCCFAHMHHSVSEIIALKEETGEKKNLKEIIIK